MKTSCKTAENTRRNNRIAYIAEAAFEYFISIMVSGAFLAAILSSIGVPDAITGITSSLTSLSFLAQLVAVLFLKPKKNIKRTVTVLHLINQLMFVLLYMIPYIELPHIVKVCLFIMMFLCGNFLNSAVTPFKLSWLMSYVDDDKRGKFTANKEIISLLSGIVFSYAMGAVIDHYEATGKAETGFLLSGITIFVLCVLHLTSLLVVQEERFSPQQEKEKHSIKSVLGATLLDKNFRKLIYLEGIWHIGTGISVSFYGTYQINELGFSLKYVAVLSALYSIVRALSSRFFGKYADKNTWARMLILSFSLGAAGFFVKIFTVPANGKVFYPVYYIFYALYMAGANSGMMNLAFDYTTHQNRACALGVKNALGGAAGFLAALAGAGIVSTVQANGNIVLGIPVYAQQLLSLISCLTFIAAAIYLKKVICNMKRIE